MVFNWFRRQHSNESPKPEEKPVAAPPAESKAAPAEASPTAPESPSPMADDYLSWAKAAYKNIQSRQQVEKTETAAEPKEVVAEPETVTPEATETPAVAIESPAQDNSVVAETTESEVSQPIASVSENVTLETNSAATVVATEELATPTLEAVQTVEEMPTETPEAVQTVEEMPTETAETVETAETAVPFWARDDKQARIERLKEIAIEEPLPEEPIAAVSSLPTTSESEVSEIDFDEGFLWSAEVLAAQGRRPEDVSIEEITWLQKLRRGLDKTRRNIVNQLKAIVGQGPLNQDAVMAIEALLLQADVGVEATDYIIEKLQSQLRQEALPPDEAIAYLKHILRDMLDAPLQKSYKRTFAPEKDKLNIWLMTGVNGAGKTTTIGKLSHLAVKSDYQCLIAAADTFRAAAVEQVKIWGQRSGVEVIANPGQNTDPAAVVYDAIAAAQARDTELLLVDTAGRLQNKKNLMDELTKIRRIIDKKAEGATVEALLVLDATLGQNGLRQAQVFSEAAQLSGVVLTKLDGTAKGGVALAVVQQLGLPIRFIGAGEGIEDLRPFSSYEFVEALLSG